MEQFVGFGIMLYFMVVLIQFVLTVETYIQLLDNGIVKVALHALLIINTYFLLSGEKYYNDNVGVE